MKNLNEEKNGEYVARLFKYYSQYINSAIEYELPFDKISAKGLYKKHKGIFDLLNTYFLKYNLEIEPFISWLIQHENITESRLDTLKIPIVLYQYKEFIIIKNTQEKIYNDVLKSINVVVEECLEFKFSNVVDYIRFLIDKRYLAVYYATGKLSLYFFAGIPTFKKIIEKLDSISKDEFKELYTRFDMYNTAFNETFLRIKNIKINPLTYANKILNKKRLNTV